MSNRNDYIGLLFECPYVTHLDNCPYRHLRNLPSCDGFKVYTKMSDELHEHIIDKHLKCRKEREDKWRKKL